MAQALVLYTRIHAPLPLRLPAQPFPPDAHADEVERCLFDLRAAEEAFREIIAPAYLAALDALRALTERGVPMSVGVSEGFLRLSRRWSPELLRPIRQLLRAPAVEAVAAEPWGGLLFAFDIEAFMRGMGAARERLAQLGGSPPCTAEVSGFCLNHEIYHALGRLGFSVIAAEGGAQARAGHQPGHPSRWREGPLVL
jgi:hypothetical protein